MELEEWFRPFLAYFDPIESSEGLTITCRRCRDELVFTNHGATLQILARMEEHLRDKHGHDI